MGKGVLAGGIVGGLLLFAWGAIAHMALPLGDTGMSFMTQEDAVIAAVRGAAPQPGFYFFPGFDMRVEQSPEQTAAWTAKYMAGPSGLLLVGPTGVEPMSAKLLVAQYLSDTLSALIAAWLLAQCAARAFGARVLFVGALGVLATVVVNVPYWNWYGFPGDFTCAAFIENTVGFLLAGLALAKLVKPAS